MEIKGQIRDIIYQNELNGYKICVLENQEQDLTVVGYLPFINSGDTVILQGRMVNHQDYGEQFKIETFEKIMPETLEGLVNYLGSGLIKGIGLVTAQKIVDKFGEETIHIFKFEPEKLSCIKGISKPKAIEISNEFNEKWDLWQIVQFLEKFGIGANNATKLYNEFGSNTIGEIEKNPYRLIDLVYGIDFKKIDKIALELGVDLRFSKRIESAIKYALIVASNNGNTCVAKENLVEFIINLLDVDIEHIETGLINCKMNNEIVIDDQEWVFLYHFNKAEENIANKLCILQNSQNSKKIKDISKEIAIIQETSDIELSDKQVETIKMINENNVSVITGGPGTGKTTIIKSIIDIYKRANKKIALCAPTGRAAKRITETTGEEAKTIHRLLELGKFDDNFINVDENIGLIDADIVIIDEMSMVDMFLMNYLLKGIYQGSKFIMVGDINQLPSVGPGSILKDIISSDKIPVVELNTIFRQAAKSKIVLNAHNVNNGSFFENCDDEETDFYYVNEGSTLKILNNVITLSTERLKKFGDYNFFENIQIMSPTKKGDLGTKELNRILQDSLNKPDYNKKERKYGDQTFREGDRVMQVKNNYDLVWSRNMFGDTESGAGIFNGEIGRINCIDDKDKKIQIIFDDNKNAWYDFADLEQLELAYAITIHKAQGSEFDVCIIVVPATAPVLLTRNLLYTGITRARKMLIVIGGKHIIEYMINNINIKNRNTGLIKKLYKLEF